MKLSLPPLTRLAVGLGKGSSRMRLSRNYTPNNGSPVAVTSIQRIAYNTSCYNNCIGIFFKCKEKKPGLWLRGRVLVTVHTSPDSSG